MSRAVHWLFASLLFAGALDVGLSHAESLPVLEVAEAEAAGTGDTQDAGAGPQVQVLGTTEQRVHLVDHNGTWSMHAQSVIASELLRAWHEAGGPDVQAKLVLDYPYTLSMHRVPAERILERVLEGWSYTLHYDVSGKLARVRVYSPEPQRMFKTPRLVESLAAWKQLESGTAAPAGTDAAAGEDAAGAAETAPVQSSE